ncbi:MAG TPA: PAS domain S-box protein, partial [Vicinamibacterales bacterium]|nr:PAS domain S-box protein [Vicinamibacterales bacterium]
MPLVPSVNSQLALAACVELARATVHTTHIDDLYAAALDALTSALGVSRASILLFDSDGVMRFKAWRGISDAYRHAVEGHTPWTRGETSAQPIVIADVAGDTGLASFVGTIRAEQIEAMAFVPLEGANGVIGKFMLYYGEPRDLSVEELRWAQLIAAQVSFAIELRQTETARAVASGQSLEASQRLAAIVKWSDDAIVSKDLNGIIQSWNAGAERMFGYSAEEAIGSSNDIIVPPDRLEEEARVLDSLRRGLAVEAMESIRRHKDGSLVSIAMSVSPVKDAEGRIVGAAKIARDIGIRRRHEAEQAELHRRLTALV